MPPESAEQEAILWTLEEQAPRYNEWLLERIRPFLGTDVLEIGAGIGTFTLMLAQAPNVRRVVALEPDKELAGTLVERTTDVGNAEVLQTPVEQLLSERHSACARVVHSFSYRLRTLCSSARSIAPSIMSVDTAKRRSRG